MCLEIDLNIDIAVVLGVLAHVPPVVPQCLPYFTLLPLYFSLIIAEAIYGARLLR